MIEHGGDGALQAFSSTSVADADAFFRATVDNLEQAIYLYRPIWSDGRIVDLAIIYVNAAALALPLSDGIVEGALASRVFKYPELAMIEAEVAWRDGQCTPYSIQRDGFINGVQRSIRYEVTTRHVGNLILQTSSDRTVADDLQRSESLLRSVLDSLSESVRVFDREGTTEYANEASVSLLGPVSQPIPHTQVYLATELDGIPLAAEDYPLARGRRGETISDLKVAVYRDGELPRLCSVAVRPLFDSVSDEPSRVVVSAHDITEISRHAAELEWFATHKRQSRMLNLDGLLGAVQQRTQQTGGSFALIWIILTGLDTIRHTLGFAAGDAALLSAAARVTAIAEQHGAIATQPEDSALALLVPDVAHMQRITDDMVTELSKPFVLESISLLLAPAIGCTIGPLPGDDAETLVRRSKTAAWYASMTGANVLHWRAELGAAQLERVSLLGEFGQALAREELFFEFQPKLDVLTHRFVGAEALVRWTHPERGPLSPEGFVDSVEGSALCRPFTMWAIRRALSQWAPVAARFPGSKVAVNVPVRLITDFDFLEQLAAELVSVGADPSWLQIEMSERGLIGNIAEVQAGLEQISMLGVSVALDDFGIGQSSLAFLRKLPLDEVKIDRAFITNLQVDLANQAIVTMCVAIGRAGSMRICAEGIETEEEMAAVTQLGCDYAQGFLLGQPMTIAAILARID